MAFAKQFEARTKVFLTARKMNTAVVKQSTSAKWLQMNPVFSFIYTNL